MISDDDIIYIAYNLTPSPFYHILIILAFYTVLVLCTSWGVGTVVKALLGRYMYPC